MFVGMQDVAVMAEDKVGDSGNNTLAVRTGDEQHGGVFHVARSTALKGCGFSRAETRSLKYGLQPLRQKPATPEVQVGLPPLLPQRLKPSVSKPTAALKHCATQNRLYFFKCFNISRAAFAPDPPVNPAPGCVPDPHRYKC